ncbi:MAG: hypothetical protein K0Q64_2159 [Nitrobacter vulgaris]|nr:hypothetical protein [Nitrobacter vulgaris]
MGIGASGRSALIIAAGLLLGFAGPMRATDSVAEPAGVAAARTEKAAAPVRSGKLAKHPSHKRQATRTRKSTKPESKTDKAEETTASAIQDSNEHIPLPPKVANANASTDISPGTTEDLSKDESPKTQASALANSASEMLAANQGDAAPHTDNTSSLAAAVDIVPSDELNEIDRALADNQQDAPRLALASIDITSPSGGDTGQATSSDSSAWNHTSLIGKIFIAFGGLLTIGSAARMFMA